MEDGMTEEEAVAAFGSVEEVAQNAMKELSLPVLMKAKVNESKMSAESKTVWIILAVLGFPIWFPLLMSFFGVIVALYATVWSLIIALFAVVFSLGVGGTAGLFASVPAMFTLTPASGAFLLGASLFLIGLTLFLIKPAVLIAKGLVQFTVWVIRQIKGLFITKQA